MTNDIATLISFIPFYSGVGFGLGMVVLVVCYGVGKCWSLIHTAD